MSAQAWLPRPLWRSGPFVSPLGLGTAALGMAYGPPGSLPDRAPSPEQARAVIRKARAAGITFFDTAPGYAAAETLLGDVLGADPDITVATKVAPMAGAASQVERITRQSLESSLRVLRRPRLDIVQIHSARIEHLAPDGMIKVLAAAVQEGLVGAIGATVYDEASALAACATGEVRILQVGFNIFDQRMVRRVWSAAQAANTGIVARSTLMKGILGPGARNLPDKLRPLRDAAEALCGRLECDLHDLPVYAMRFCLYTSGIANALTGAVDERQLEAALRALEAGPLSPTQLEILQQASIDDAELLNPSQWPQL